MIGLLAGGVALAQIDTTAEPGRPSDDPATAMCMRTDKVNEKLAFAIPMLNYGLLFVVWPPRSF